jgi:O-succinylbenzoic acid--CoA ligase
VADGRSWTFAELDSHATRVARQLASAGASAGDRVATLLHGGAMPAVLAHAVLRLGATLVPLNVRLSDVELAWQVGDAGARVLLIEGRTATLAARARDEQPEIATVSVDAVDGVPLLADLPEADVSLRLAHEPSAVHSIIYTSGTTGRPKGAMLTVDNFWWNATGSALNLGTHADDRWLACLPLFHVGGLSILLRSAIYGITAVVHDGFDAEAVNRAIDDERITIVSVVAVTLQRMLDAHGDRPYPPTLRCVLLGGGPAPRSLLERCAALGVPVVQTYGLTETASQVVTLAPEDALAKLGSAGKPLYPNELRIAADDGADAMAGTAGEILVRGPVVMAGYFGRPDASGRAIVDGWLHTGDVGYLDAEGYLYVLDRRDDLIVTGGENVYPAEVEAALLAHPSVAEAAVIGVSDERWGQRVVAVVRLTDGADGAEDALRAHCRARLGGYKVPSEIRVVAEALPRTASGKLRRAALRAPAADT